MATPRPLPLPTPRRRALVGAGAGAAVAVLLGSGCVRDDPVVGGDGEPVVVATPRPSTEQDAAAPRVAPDGRPRFTVWAQGGLPDSVPALVARVPGVVHAAPLRQDTVGLVASRTASGELVDDLSDGWRLPVQAAAIEPTQWLALLEGDSRSAVADLRPGTVVLGRDFAASRGLAAGARLDLVGLQDLDVVGVLADDALGDSELVLHAHDAEAAGVTRGPTVVVEHAAADAATRARLAADLAAAVPADVPARVVDARDPAARDRAPLVLSLAEVKARFGEFSYRPREGTRAVDADPLWEMANIVRVEVPLLGTVRCHRLVVDDLAAALQAIADAGLAGEVDPEAYQGCWYPRRISTEHASLSSHSWGIALDINVDLELPGLGPPPHPEVVAIFMRHGFRWGGHFLTPDNHHFEWVGGQVVAPGAGT